ncbi:MAG: type II secretion system F family protein [Patescibacteria group bacterium]|nr:type II secretion system F family protein [Patescibacteria group bacterium]
MTENQEQKEVRVDIGLSAEDEVRMKALAETSASDDVILKSTGNIFLDFYNKLNLYIQTVNKVPISEKVAFFELLSVMINAGMPLVRALYVLGDQIKNVKLKLIIRDMVKKVEKGIKLSDAMAVYPKVFTEAEIGMVMSGEASGSLNEILKQVSIQVQKNANLASKIKGAMIYPIVVICILIAAVIVMLTVVVPKISGIFEQSGVELPFSTKTLIFLSDIAQKHYIEALSVIGVFVVALWLFKQTKQGKYYIHRSLLHLPVMGELLKMVAISRFSRNLSSLMSSGVAIVKALEINANAIGNEVYKKRILMAAEDVAQGIPLGENLNDSKFLFPDMVVSMITVGEQTANVSEVADKIADFYEEQVDDRVTNLSKLLEPIILVVMGLVVGGLVAAVMQPIMSLTDVGNVL